MDATGAKVLAAFLFFGLVVIFGWMPSWCCTQLLKNKGRPGTNRNSQTILPLIQYMHALASGVLVATCFLHLLPESVQTVRFVLGTIYEEENPHHVLNRDSAINSTENINMTFASFNEENRTVYDVNFFDDNTSTIKDEDKDSGEVIDLYPVAEILVALGFLSVYMVDSMIKSFRNYKSKKATSEHDITNDNQEIVLYESHRHRDDSSVRVKWRTVTATSSAKASTYESANMLQSESCQELSSTNFHEKFDEPSETLLSGVAHIQHNPGFSDTEVLEHNSDAQQDDPLSAEVDDAVLVQSSQEFHEIGEKKQALKLNHLRSAALVTALCIHGFFDGMMIGLQTSLSALKSVMFALALHKSFVTVGLSLTLIGNKTSSRLMFYYILAFASMAPLGVFTGALSIHLGEDTLGKLLPGCLQSFAVGTFLYVCFTETIERHEPMPFSQEIVSHIFLLTGFVFMAGFRAYTGSV